MLRPAKRAELSQRGKVTPAMRTLTATGQVRLQHGDKVLGITKGGSNAKQKRQKDGSGMIRKHLITEHGSRGVGLATGLTALEHLWGCPPS